MRITNDIDAILASARCKFDGVYFVGPFGARVSFASQQLRVFNLIWALAQRKVLPSNKEIDVAVVGGGIAGVTAAAALLCLNCNVWMYERKGEVLSVQRQSHHRMVHPTINFWPETELGWTTEFPFFDWYAGECVEILAKIALDWRGFRDPYGTYDGFEDRLAEVYRDTTVSSFQNNRKKVQAIVDGKVHGTYDLIFVTSGFGSEKKLTNHEHVSYWLMDEVDELADQAGLRLAVSGTGDGGLIDALRLTYAGFMKDELALKFLHFEDRTNLRKELANIEEDVRNEKYSDADRAEIYAREYARLAGARSIRSKRLLKPLKTGKIPVTLIGKRPTPFDVGAAPIHKLILAYSILENRIHYCQGELTRLEGKWILTRPDGTTIEVKYDHVVVRHGAIPPAIDFLGKDETERLKIDQRIVGDYITTNSEPTNRFYDNPKIYPEHNTRSGLFVARRRSLAQSFLSKRFSLDVRAIRDDSGNYKFEALRRDDTPENHIDLPKSLFGIELLPPANLDLDVDPLLS